jgi:hypothetical protein
MSEWWLVLLATAAAYRVTRVVTTDKITEPVFERLRWTLERRWQAKHGDGSDTDWNSKLAYLLSCPWCLGFWVSGVFTVILSMAYGLDYPILTWFAMSTGIGLLARIDSE